MASLNRSRGRYYLQFHDDARHPRRRTVALGTSDQEEAQAKKQVLERAFERGLYDPWVDDEPRAPKKVRRYLTLRDAADEFVRERRHVKASSLGFYRKRLRPFVTFLGERTPVRRLTGKDVVRFLDSTNANDTTRRTYLGAYAAFFAYLVETDALDANPCDGVRLRKAPAKFPKALTLEEVDRLCVVIEAHHEDKSVYSRTDHRYLVAVVRTTVYTGLRRAEICHLRWRDVDLDARAIYVRNADGFETKDSEDRVVPLTAPALTLFRAMRAERAPRPEDFVYTVGGRPIHPDSLTWRFRYFAKRAGLDATVHALRHTALSWLAMKGVPVEALRQFAGHSTIAMTSRYVHATPRAYHAAISEAF